MRSRLPELMPELFAFVGSGVLSVKGPVSGTAFTLVLDSEMLASTVLRRHRAKPFEGIFGVGAAAQPLVIQPDRERWLQKLLSMQWPVIEFLRALPTVEDATCKKYRVGARRYVKLHVIAEGQEILRFVGTGEFEEVDAESPEPNK